MEATKEDLIDLLVRTKRWMEELDAIGITNDDLYTDIENTLTGEFWLECVKCGKQRIWDMD